MFYTKKLIPSIKQSLFLNILLTCVFNRIGLNFLSPQIIQTIQMLRKTVPHHHHLPSASELFRNAGTLKLQTHWNSLIKWYKCLQWAPALRNCSFQWVGTYIYHSGYHQISHLGLSNCFIIKQYSISVWRLKIIMKFQWLKSVKPIWYTTSSNKTWSKLNDFLITIILIEIPNQTLFHY